ncbi:cyclase family protein [Chthoniobacter flavus]|uniref:cyclase family protein n=1 Tax=Chthoniobacter flavus TaxID=191863 RepID=UPI0012FA4AEA|nr:cyclase family protein [Chthoniobacter flavus]
MILGLGILPGTSLKAQDARPQVTHEDVERWMTELSNWGRWGKEDQLGALNLLTAEKRKAAAAQVHEGVSVSCARDAETKPAPDNGSPFVHEMLLSEANAKSPFVTDRFSVVFHGLVHTHLDALCHMSRHGQMYNGFARTEITKEGAAKLSVNGIKKGIITRGVLLDLPRSMGVDALRPGMPIYPADLDACLEKEGVKVLPGDAVLIRTGRWKRRDEQGAWVGEFAGLHAACGPWLRAHDVAVLGTDAAADVIPARIEGESMPIHQLTLVAMGIWILDACDFEALAAQAEKSHRWEFMLTASPLAVPGATGSPINPVATF